MKRPSYLLLTDIAVCERACILCGACVVKWQSLEILALRAKIKGSQYHLSTRLWAYVV